MIAIVDYGSGNITALSNVYRRLGIPAAVATTPGDLERATHIVLPGVGAFDQAMAHLKQSGLQEALTAAVMERRLPLLGVCVGMQLLGTRSDEGSLSGLGWIDGTVTKFAATADGERAFLPHMGWNDVELVSASPLFAGLEEHATFYFLHSYYFNCNHTENVLAATMYGRRFASAVRSDNIFGVQFHPEKSHRYGVRLLKNFAEL